MRMIRRGRRLLFNEVTRRMLVAPADECGGGQAVPCGCLLPNPSPFQLSVSVEGGGESQGAGIIDGTSYTASAQADFTITPVLLPDGWRGGVPQQDIGVTSIGRSISFNATIAAADSAGSFFVDLSVIFQGIKDPFAPTVGMTYRMEIENGTVVRNELFGVVSNSPPVFIDPPGPTCNVVVDGSFSSAGGSFPPSAGNMSLNAAISNLVPVDC